MTNTKQELIAIRDCAIEHGFDVSDNVYVEIFNEKFRFPYVREESKTNCRKYHISDINAQIQLMEQNEKLEAKVAELEDIVNQVAHIGVDMGEDCGEFYITENTIEKARELMSNDY